MSRRSNIVTLILALLFSSVPLVLGLYSGAGIFLPEITLPLSIALIALSSIFFREGKKMVSSIMVLSSLFIAFLSAMLLSLFFHKAGVGEALQFGLVSLIPYLAIVPIYINKEKKGVSLMLLTAAFSFLLWLGLSQYLRRYIFLFELTGGYRSFSSMSKACASFVFLALLGESVFKTQRNYITYCSLFVSALLYGFLETMKADGTNHFLVSFFSSVPFWVVLAVDLTIYLDEKPPKREWERRNIIFKDLIYEEVKPIRKRVRKQIFEIPPNVPKMKRNFTQDMKNEGIKNGKNDQ